MESYGVNALDYALKPITQEKMTQVFKRYLAQRPQEMNYLLVDYQGYPHKLNLQDIVYIEAAKHQTVLTLCNEETLTLNMNTKPEPILIFELVHRTTEPHQNELP